MPFSITWDETIPIDHTKFRQQPGFVRDSKTALRERLAVDHYLLASEGADTKIGYHKKCTFVEQTTDPAAVADAGILYTKDVATITELFYRNSAGTIIQITSGSGINGGFVPTGGTIAYGGSSAPAGWLLCDGSAVSRTTYAVLFAIVGTTFGAGDGSTTFNLPDLRGRFPLGKATAGTGSVLGGTGGAIDHTHGAGSFAGTDHSHSFSATSSTPSPLSNGCAGGAGCPHDNHTHSVSGTTGNAGAGAITGTSASNNPPFQVVNYIIKN